MAKLLYSTQVGDMRNKVGGCVHTKTRFGSMARRKVSPVQPRSSSQMNVRASFTGLAKAWSALTDAQRAAWIALAANYPIKDVFSNTVVLTGLQAYVRCNRALATVGVAALSDPPANLNVNYAGPITAAHDGPPVTTMTVTWTNAGNMGGSEYAVIYATAPMSAGRATGGARFRKIFVSGAGVTGPYSVLTEYTEKFGAPITGRKIFFRAVLVRNSTGAISLPSEYALTI